MSLNATRSLWGELLYQPVISTTCCKHIAPLVVKDALEKNATSEKLVVQTGKRVNIDFPLHVELLQVIDYQVQASKNWSQSFGKWRALHDSPQFLMGLFRRV